MEEMCYSMKEISETCKRFKSTNWNGVICPYKNVDTAFQRLYILSVFSIKRKMCLNCQEPNLLTE